MGKRGLALAVALGIAATISTGTALADPVDKGDRIDRKVVQEGLDELARTGAQGVQLRVVDGRRSFTARSGTARIDSSQPVPTDGRFRIGSITKTFVSTVVLQLVGEGRVALDAPVSRYLPGLLPDGDVITVRNLLQHTSGLYNYTNDIPQDPAEFEKIRYDHRDPRELVALSAAHPLDFRPGTSWAYSNTNYAVAGLLVEKVTGRPYGDAVRRRVLAPLGLRDTSLPGDRVDVPGPHAHGYYEVAGVPVDITRLNPSAAYAAGEIISTTADLDRFFDALLDGRLLKPAEQKELTHTLPSTRGYGLGIYSTDLSCGVTVWGHDGGIPGYLSAALSTRDTSTRLEISLTSAPREGTLGGYQKVLTEVFC
ncbi:serine hydrolase domain-containing protein [Actinosynnema sp. NPDC020468]|uniref:serine hydrolase domain-containing protein n=1 Tax=Actinosynnema sp. NPDC020468 TaxID=3154488 RepID=UPI0033F01471